VVKALCRTLSSPDLPKDVRRELEGEALFNALKLFSEAVSDRLGSLRERWSPALVEAFKKEPEKCDQFLELMSEPKFSAEDYWRQ
jgi:hypothetical protein